MLYNLCETLRIISILLEPFLPETSPKIQAQLRRFRRCGQLRSGRKWNVTPAGAIVKKGETLFPRIDVDREIEELNQLIPNPEAAKEKAEPAPKEKPEGIAQITIDDFAKVDLRAAKVVACEPVKRSRSF